ncbi:cysteine--tRNA ligase [Candidatus Aerophobetes bacterium]|nr:cysteine--tRNA ligase [Candidatus Aerophobetes bacterium]
MGLKIYNTLTKRKENFSPLEDRVVKIYACGVTLYDKLHLGHARAAVVFDMIRRYLEYRGYKVIYVTNFTDVDDKMIQRAKELGITIFELAERFIDEYFDQMRQLGVKRADFYPRATEHIQEIIDLIRRLEEKGIAYARNGDVFFRVKKFPDYGKLSGQSLSELFAGARVEVDEKKESPFDFALWKKAKEGEPWWESPWGRGRPGWHIECSCMAMKYLGETIDIHGGGKDLIFPHHENEIAQSEAATGKKFVRFWVHNGLVTMKGQKMAKSTGNFITLSDALKEYDGEVIRFYLLSAHYRSPLEYSKTSLEEAASSLERVYTTLERIEEVLERKCVKYTLSDIPDEIKSISRRFFESMDDDFNTPSAFACIFELAKQANLIIEGKQNGNRDFILSYIKDRIEEAGKILGLFQKKKEGLEEKTEKLIQILIEIRDVLRREKNWKIADMIRERLKEIGIQLEDGREKTVWRLKRDKIFTEKGK